ncbi:hypothetical protein AOLI_G00093650 [Acnodon oligacanthus]
MDGAGKQPQRRSRETLSQSWQKKAANYCPITEQDALKLPANGCAGGRAPVLNLEQKRRSPAEELWVYFVPVWSAPSQQRAERHRGELGARAHSSSRSCVRRHASSLPHFAVPRLVRPGVILRKPDGSGSPWAESVAAQRTCADVCTTACAFQELPSV